jgi:hypothetical protein
MIKSVYIALVTATLFGVTGNAHAGGTVRAAAPDAAKPEVKADCEFVEISASTTATAKVDTELAGMEKKLKKPPFSSWNTFKQLGRVSRTVVQLKSETVKLSAGSVSVLLREVTTSKNPRLALSVTMDDSAGKRVMDTKVSVDAGEFFLIGRSLANNEGHVLALACKL